MLTHRCDVTAIIAFLIQSFFLISHFTCNLYQYIAFIFIFIFISLTDYLLHYSSIEIGEKITVCLFDI
jgi:uncharacterized membrane protein YesL